MKNNQFRFFSGKIVTFLDGNFTMEEAVFKNIFLHKIFICQPIFKIFVALFKTFGMQNGDRLKFFLSSFRKVRFRKMQFLKDGVQTVVSHWHANFVADFRTTFVRVSHECRENIHV